MFPMIAIAAVLAFGIVVYVNTEREIIENTNRELTSLASVQEDAISVVMKNNFESLVAFTTRVQLKIELDNFNQTGDEESRQFISNLISGAKAQITSFREISILNPDGIVVASTDEQEVGVDHAGADFFQKGRQSNDITAFFTDKHGDPSQYLVGPLVLDERLVGVVVITSDVADIYSITGIHSNLSETGESYLVMRNEAGDGVILTPLRFEPDAALKVTIPKDNLDAPTTLSLLGNERTFMDSIDYRGQHVIAATRYIGDLDLGLVVKIDAQEAFAPLDSIRYLTIIAGLTGVIFVVAVSLYLGRSISFPIIRLRDRMAEITRDSSEAGAGRTPPEIKGKDEVAELTFHFDKMTENIESLRGNLQQLVQEKTVESEATNTLKLDNASLQELNKVLEEQADQLRKGQIAMQEFASMITHELKTPLVSIIGYGSLLLNNKIGELTPRQKEKLQIMFNSAQRLATLIQDLLDVQKLELGALHLNIVQASAGQIIEDSISSLTTEAENKGVVLVNRLGNDVTLKCDPSRIGQVLNNLISNGIKFSREKGTIEIDARMENGSAVFSVKDDGIGIPKDKQDRIFTKFYQVDTSLTRKTGGTGLGLVICKGIVEAHKGKMWFESDEGKGSIFTFSIPGGEPVGKENPSG